MDQNKFLQTIQQDMNKIVQFNGDEQSRQFENASNATVAYTEQVKMLQQALADLSRGNYIKDINNSLMDFAREVYNLNIDETLKQKFLNMQSSAGSAADQMKNHMRDISESVRDALDPNANPSKFTEALAEIALSSNELVQAMKILEDSVKHVREEAGKELRMEGADKVLEIVSKLSKEFIYLDNGMQAFYKGIPNNFFDGLIKDTDTFSEAIKKLSETVNSNAGNISSGLSNMVDSKVSQDAGNLFLIRQIESAINSLGNTASGHQGALSKIFNEITTLSNTSGSGFDSDAVSAYRENLESTFVQLENLKQKQDELKLAMGDDNKKDPAMLTKDLVEYQVIQTKVYSSMQDLVRLTSSLDLNKSFDKKPVDDLLNVLKAFGQEAITVNNTLNTMGINMPNQITPQMTAQTQSQFDTGVGSSLMSRAGNVLTGMSRVGKGMLNVAGLGSILSPMGMLGGVFSQDNRYGDLYANSSIYDMIATQGAYNSSAHDSAVSRGLDYGLRTNGLIDGFDLEATRRDLTKSVMGQYRQSDANSTADISKLSDMSLIFQKGLGISSGDMNSSINTFYKELNMTLPETEYLMSKVASQAQAMNIPFDKHLKQVESLALNYRDVGLSVDDAINSMNNLMNVQGLNQRDAYNVSNDIGKGISSMDDGSAAFFGMNFGGFSNPFAAINNYRMNKWNSDGSVNENWADQWGQIFADKNSMMSSIGGGGAESQWILYNQYKQAGMSDKTSALLSQTNDAQKIADILKSDGKNVDGTTVGDSKEKEFQNSMDTITKRIEDASDNLSGVTQVLNTLRLEQEKTGVTLHDAIKGAMDPVQATIKGLGDSLNNVANFVNSIQDLEAVNKLLETASWALFGAILANTAIQGYNSIKGMLPNGGGNAPNSVSRTPSGGGGGGIGGAAAAGAAGAGASNAPSMGTRASRIAAQNAERGGIASKILNPKNLIRGTATGLGVGLLAGAIDYGTDWMTNIPDWLGFDGGQRGELSMLDQIKSGTTDDGLSWVNKKSQIDPNSPDFFENDPRYKEWVDSFEESTKSSKDQTDATKNNTNKLDDVANRLSILNLGLTKSQPFIGPPVPSNLLGNDDIVESASSLRSKNSAGSVNGGFSAHYTDIDSSAINKRLGGVLANHGQDFISAGKKYDINPALLAAISMHETGNGTSSAAINKNNLGGMMSSDGSGLMQFATFGEGLDKMASNLKRLYLDDGLDTIEKIQKRYAPNGAANDPTGLNSHWVGGVTNFYNRITDGNMSYTPPTAIAGSSAASSGSYNISGGNSYSAPISALYGRHSAFGNGVDMNWSTKGMYDKSISEADNSSFNNQAFAKEVGKSNINLYIQATDPNQYETMGKFFQEKMDQAKKEWDLQNYQNKLQQ